MTSVSKADYLFKVSLKQQILVLIPFFGINAGLAIVYFAIARNYPLTLPLYLVILFFFLLNVLPVLLLHFQYLSKNWKATLEIDTRKQLIRYTNHDETKIVSFHNISELKYFATHGHISTKGSSLFYTFDPYRYYSIKSNDGTTIIVTCLMINDLENSLEPLIGIKAERKFRMVPLVY